MDSELATVSLISTAVDRVYKEDNLVPHKKNIFSPYFNLTEDWHSEVTWSLIKSPIDPEN